MDRELKKLGITPLQLALAAYAIHPIMMAAHLTAGIDLRLGESPTHPAFWISLTLAGLSGILGMLCCVLHDPTFKPSLHRLSYEPHFAWAMAAILPSLHMHSGLRPLFPSFTAYSVIVLLCGLTAVWVNRSF